MRKRDVGDLSFTEEEQRELRQQEDEEHRRHPAPQEALPAKPKPEAGQFSLHDWLRSLW